MVQRDGGLCGVMLPESSSQSMAMVLLLFVGTVAMLWESKPASLSDTRKSPVNRAGLVEIRSRPGRGASLNSALLGKPVM